MRGRRARWRSRPRSRTIDRPAVNRDARRPTSLTAPARWSPRSRPSSKSRPAQTVTFDQTTPAVSLSSTSLMAPRPSDACTPRFPPFPTARGRWTTSPPRSASAGSAGRPEQGFSLNGAHYWIQGGNVHQDHAGWGDGVADSALYRDVQDGQGRGAELHSRLALSQGAGLRGCLRPARRSVLVGELLLGRLRRRRGVATPTAAYPSTSADYSAFDANVLAEPHGHDPHPSQSPEHHRVEHGQRGLLHRTASRHGGRAAQERGGPDPPAGSGAPARDNWGPGRPAAIGGAQSAIGSTQPDKLGDVAGFNGDGTGTPTPACPIWCRNTAACPRLGRAPTILAGRTWRSPTACPPNTPGERSVQMVHVRSRQPRWAPRTGPWASSTTSVFRSAPTTGIETPMRKLRRRPGRPRARPRG